MSNIAINGLSKSETYLIETALALVIFAIEHTFVFIVATVFIVAFTAACWLTSRDAILAKAEKKFHKTTVDYAIDAKALVAIWALLKASGTVASPSNKKVKASLLGPYKLREILERSKRFQKDVVSEYFR